MKSPVVLSGPEAVGVAADLVAGVVPHAIVVAFLVGLAVLLTALCRCGLVVTIIVLAATAAHSPDPVRAEHALRAANLLTKTLEALGRVRRDASQLTAGER